MATSKAEIRDRFSQQIAAVADSMDALGQGQIAQAQRKWPELDLADWNGDLSNLEGVSSAFDRSENGDDVVAAIRDPADPGVTGDLAASILQGDWLAALERAWRSRHLTRPRLYLHAAARRKGHGHPAGVIRRGMLGLVEGILQKSKV